MAGSTPPASGANNPRFLQALEKLGADFTSRLPDRLQEARDLLAQCRDQPMNTEPLARLHRLLHTLAGSAGTFGYRPLGAHAKTIELQASEIMKKPSRDAADFEPLFAQIERLADLAVK